MFLNDDKEKKSKHEKRRSRSRSRSKDSWEGQREKRSRSREMKPPRGDDRLLQEVLKRERDHAATSRKEDYAKRPASYKSSLSLQLPVGSARRKEHHRENSPER